MLECFNLKTLEELVNTEAAYVSDLGALVGIKAVVRKICDANIVDSLFANIEALHGINTELLSALRGEGDAPPAATADDALERVSTAFETLAPYLRAYSLFCTVAISSQERVKVLRSANAALEQVMGEVEQATGQSMGSWLIRPVQRLCKYPLLLGALQREVEEGTPAHERLASAVERIQAVVNDVNERVRVAEEREGLLVLADALGRREEL
eukprot:6153346-Prymnesium_polylepis.1